MEYNKNVQDLHPGDKIEGFYILKECYHKTSASGKPFLAAVISDKTGTVDLKVWDYSGPVGADPADAGKVIKIRGDVSEFKGAPQVIATHIRLATDQDGFDLSRLVPVAPINADREYAAIQALVDSIQDNDYRAVATQMLARHADRFRRIPAAKSVHHSFISGLLMHTANMLKLADFLSTLYGGFINRSLLLTGTLLHDFAKETEFCFSELGLVTDYSVKGQLLGHLVMGAREAEEVCRELGVPEEKSVLLQHLILSHHGEPDYGAAVRPMTAEADLLHHIDLIDSRMEIYAESLPEIPVGTFSPRIFALEKRVYRHE